MTDIPARMAPVIDDGNREFWTSGAHGELRMPRCERCHRWAFPPAAECPACGGRTGYATLSGRGRVFTYTVNRQVYNPEVPVPYVVAIVELEEQEGLQFTTNVIGCEPDEVEIGMLVRVVFEPQGAFWVPLFEPDH